MVRGAVREVWLPAATALVADVERMARELRDQPMLARTHGQPATPTTLGKELAVLAHRLRRQLRRVERAEYLGKINGATGTYGAHVAGAPGTDWLAVSRAFVEHLGLVWNPLTTQIESHDWQAELYADVARFNRVLHNLCTDVWTYISLGYFAQVPTGPGHGRLEHDAAQGQPDPVRERRGQPRGQLALLDLLASTLVTSRLQRDLTDSTTQRNIGTAFGHSLLAIENVRRGLAGLDADPGAMAADLDENWEVLGEACSRSCACTAWSSPTSGSRSSPAAAGSTAAALRAFVESLGLPGRRPRPAARADAGDLHRPRPAARRPARAVTGAGDVRARRRPTRGTPCCSNPSRSGPSSPGTASSRCRTATGWASATVGPCPDAPGQGRGRLGGRVHGGGRDPPELRPHPVHRGPAVERRRHPRPRPARRRRPRRRRARRHRARAQRPVGEQPRYAVRCRSGPRTCPCCPRTRCRPAR